MHLRTSLRWSLVGTLVVAAGCSASDSADFNVGFEAGVRVDGARSSDAAHPADTGRAGDAGRVDGSATGGDGATHVDGSDPNTDGASTQSDGASDDGATSAVCGTRELCNNGLDDNCNGTVDENCPCLPGATQHCVPGDPAHAGRGVCVWGTTTCEGTGEFGTWSACVGAGSPQPVACGGMDYLCDGIVDEGCACDVGAMRLCYTGPAGTDMHGVCRDGTQTCELTASGAAWGACVGEIIPGARDLCDGVDRDCDGTINGGCVCAIGANRLCYTGAAGTQGVGICHQGTQPCVHGPDGVSTDWGACVNQVVPAAAEICANHLDDNCNGQVDEGCPPPVTTCPGGAALCGGVCCAAADACALGVCVGNGQLRFTLTWDVMADLDLAVTPPCGTEIYYGNTSACGGSLDHDSCPALSPYAGDSCHGPENIYWPSAPSTGAYAVCVNPWEMNSGSTAHWTVNVYRGTTLIQTWTGTRSGSSGYVRCQAGGSTYVGTITI